MKRSFNVFLLSLLVIAACQKELGNDSDPAVPAEFTLDGAGGDCAGAVVNGTYKVDSACGPANSVTLAVNVSTAGKYSIATTTVNGIQFSDTGTFVATGPATITLNAVGTPLASGNFKYVVDASPGCSFVLTVNTPSPNTAVYSMAGGPGACAPITVNGTYKQAEALTAANTAVVNVDVTTPGPYYISTNAANGIIFKAAGTFASSGLQPVTLVGEGTPVNAGVNTFAPQTGTSSCTFTVTTASNAIPAVYTMAGAPGNCTGALVNGIYKETIPLTSSNTVSVSVNVTTAGAYTLSTNTVNGISFSASGKFTTTGVQNVLLKGTGTPIATAASVFTPQTGTSQCNFTVNVAPAITVPAVFTLGGAPGACTGAVVNGTYTFGVTLTASNTATIQVNVTTAGDYTITTNTVNGIKFSSTGIFITTGVQTVTLAGTGIPSAPGTATLTPQAGTSTCTFDVPVVAPVTVGKITCKINGTAVAFNVDAYATVASGGGAEEVTISGLVTAGNSEELSLDITKASGTVGTGTYQNTLAASTAGLYLLSCAYVDVASAIWSPSAVITPAPDPFTITITTRTATNIKGTFSGTIRDNAGSGTNTKNISEGAFDVPVQ